MPINDQSAAIPYFPGSTYPVNTVGAALQTGAVGAPVNSPLFTGDPRAPTPGAADNDTSIATTAFVKTAIAGVAIPDGSKGDITVTGASWQINAQAVGFAELVNASAQYRMLMRTSAGAGPFQELASSANVAALLQAADYSAIRTLLGLGALAVQSLVDNGDWDAAGAALALSNGGTGQKTAPLARLGLAGSWTTLTDGATISTDAAQNDRFSVTIAGSRTLANPTGIVDGVDYRWRIIQGGAGGFTLTTGSAFNFVSGTTFAISSAVGSVSYLCGIGRGTKVDVVGTAGFPA